MTHGGPQLEQQEDLVPLRTMLASVSRICMLEPPFVDSFAAALRCAALQRMSVRLVNVHETICATSRSFRPMCISVSHVGIRHVHANTIVRVCILELHTVQMVSHTVPTAAALLPRDFRVTRYKHSRLRRVDRATACQESRR